MLRRQSIGTNRNMKKVGVLLIRKVMSNVSSVGPSSEIIMFLSEKGPTLETLNITFRIGTTPTFLIFRFASEHFLRSTLRLFHNGRYQMIACNIYIYIYIFRMYVVRSAKKHLKS